MPAPASALPLAGIRVLELCQNLSGPFAGEILASLGAQVLKVERPEGDDARAWGPPFVGDTAAAFHAVNHGKHSVTLDLKEPQAMHWLKSQLADADVLLQNLRPGAMVELGLDAAALQTLNPRLVVCAIGAFGHRGPMAMQPGYEPMVQAFAGLWSVNGDAAGPATRVGVPLLDMGSGLWAALGCVAALHRRHVTGVGGMVETSLLETALGWLGAALPIYSLTGQLPTRHRSGSPVLVVFQSFETADTEVVVGAANERLFARLCAVLGHPEWASDPRYTSNALRVQHKAELLAGMEPLFRAATTQTWIDRLQAAGIPCAPVNDLAAISRAEQVQAIGQLQTLPGIDLPVVALPLSFDGVRPPVHTAAPSLGEHNILYGLPAARPDR